MTCQCEVVLCYVFGPRFTLTINQPFAIIPWSKLTTPFTRIILIILFISSLYSYTIHLPSKIKHTFSFQCHSTLVITSRIERLNLRWFN